MTKIYKIVSVIFIVGLSLTAFQNCGSDFNPDEYITNSSLSGGGPSVPVEVAPTITSQSSNVTISAGQSLSLSVGTQGTNLVYTWYRNGGVIAGASGPSYSLAVAQIGDAGTYRVDVSNSLDTKSATMVVTVNPLVPPVTQPVFTMQPTASTTMTLVVAGSFPAINIYWSPATVTLSATASGTGVTYQWYFDGANIPGGAAPAEVALAGATGTSITVNSTLNGVTRAINDFCGRYRLVATNSAGAVSSSIATVTCIAGTTVYQ